MGFDIVKTFVVHSTPENVWSLLTDPERVARCLPGAAITGKLDDHTWQGTMTVKVGPVSSSYKGKVSFEKLDPAAHTAQIVATGQDVRGRGGADLRLTSTVLPKGPGETEITTSSHVNVSGILAQMGRGMVQDVGDQMFQIFSQRVRAELESAPPAQPQPAAAPAAAGPTPGDTNRGSAAPTPGDTNHVSAAPTPGDTNRGSAAPTPGDTNHGSAAPTPGDTNRGSAAHHVPYSVPAKPEALDVGAMGARAALRSPVVWVAAAGVALLLYLILR